MLQSLVCSLPSVCISLKLAKWTFYNFLHSGARPGNICSAHPSPNARKWSLLSPSRIFSPLYCTCTFYYLCQSWSTHGFISRYTCLLCFPPVFGAFLPCSVLSSLVRHFPPVFRAFLPCSALSSRFRRFPPAFGAFLPCSALSSRVPCFPPVFGAFLPCSALSSRVRRSVDSARSLHHDLTRQHCLMWSYNCHHWISSIFKERVLLESWAL